VAGDWAGTFSALAFFQASWAAVLVAVLVGASAEDNLFFFVLTQTLEGGVSVKKSMRKLKL
jgi:hypothetical protein